jgi:hypothetical protein
MAITSAFQADDAGSIPAARSRLPGSIADIAQAVERILGKDEVPSSILGISTTSYFPSPALYIKT